MSSAAVCRLMPDDVSSTEKYPLPTTATAPSSVIATSMRRRSARGSVEDPTDTRLARRGEAGGSSSVGRSPTSWGRERRSATARPPSARAMSASARKAWERPLRAMTAALTTGMTMEATPLPIPTMPATVPMWPRYQFPMSRVTAAMPPNPYPMPVSALPRHRSASPRAAA